MYDSFDLFKTDALACGTAYYLDSSLQPSKIETAYKVYQLVKKGTKLTDIEGNPIDFGVTIVGRLALKEKAPEGGKDEYIWVPSNEDFPSIDQILKENLKTVDEVSSQAGSILDAQNWSLLCNDAWLLGSIHAQTEFHFASPLSWTNLWDDGKKRMTVTGREVIGIISNGYQIKRPYPQLEAVAVLDDSQKAATASLITYKDSVQKYSTPEALQEFFKTIPVEATSYS